MVLEDMGFSYTTSTLQPAMLLKESLHDVKTKDGGTMRIFVIEPNLPDYPEAKFPGCVVFSEVRLVGGDRCRALTDQ